MNDFKIGEVVRCIDAKGASELIEGIEYVVRHISIKHPDSIGLEGVGCLWPTRRFVREAATTIGKIRWNDEVHMSEILDTLEASFWNRKISTFTSEDYGITVVQRPGESSNALYLRYLYALDKEVQKRTY